MEDKAVLFVDDEASILTSLQRLLRKEPYTVHTAVGGPAGLELLKEHKVHMVVSDQRMPEMSGTQFLQQVKELYPDTIRMVLSGYAEAAAIVDAINEGEVFRFIGKPWKDEDLRVTIRRGLEHYDIIRENQTLQHQSIRQLEELQRLNALLESSVEDRTRSLRMSQEVLESLPLIVVGVSQEEELVLTNQRARCEFDPLCSAIPGTDIDEILPPEAVAAIRSCLYESKVEEFEFDWEGRHLRAQPARLGTEEAPRGCVLLLNGE